MSTVTEERGIIYWHRELPLVDAEWMGEYVLEATSGRVGGLGGHYAHVLDESIDSKHDNASGDKRLQGRFTYVLYRRSP